MSQINPFTGAIVQGMQVQPRQSAEKDRQIRRTQNLSKNSALQGDELEHQVESADAPQAVSDGQDNAHGRMGQGFNNPQRRTPRRQQNPKPDVEDGGTGHVDVTA
jgi:hypothetical protein